MRILACMNQKGGVGKTTTVVNLSAALARRGKRVLIVDCDPQANASTHLGVNIHAGHLSLYDVLTNKARITETRIEIAENLSLVPSELDLAGAEIELVSTMGRETLLRDALTKHFAEGHEYEFIFFDCPPSLGLLPLNALAAAREVAIILQAEFFALQGISQLTSFIDLVVDRINPNLEVSTVITCMYDSRTRFGKEVIEDITQHFAKQLMKTFIRRNVKLAEATSHGVSIFDYDAASPGAQDYAALAREFLERDAARAKSAAKLAAQSSPRAIPNQSPSSPPPTAPRKAVDSKKGSAEDAKEPATNRASLGAGRHAQPASAAALLTLVNEEELAGL